MKPLFNIDEKRALWALTVLILLTRTAFALLSDRLLFGGPFVEDAYYSLSVARHLAMGQGLTVDGVHATNGVQPLIMLLQSLCFLITGGDRLSGLRLCYVLAAIINAAFIWAMAWLIKSMERKDTGGLPVIKWWQSPVVIAAAMQTFIFSLFSKHVNGMETGLNALMIVLFLGLYSKLRKNNGKVKSFALLGVVGGFLVLSRIDAAVLVAIVALLELRYANGFRNSTIMSCAAFIVSSPWWIYSYTQFGSLMPVSGQSESIGPWWPESLVYAGKAAGEFFFFYIPKWQRIMPEWISIPILLISAYGIFRASRHYGIMRKLRSIYDLSAIRPLFLFSLFLIVYYMFFFRAPWFLDRYWHPVEVLWITVVAMALPIAYGMIQGIILRNKRVSYPIIIAASLAIIFVNARVDRSIYLPKFPTGLAEIGFWAREHPNATIGAYQSGTAGFLADNVINLDGKVNLEALRARQHDSLGAYIKSKRFDYLADEWDFMVFLLGDSTKFNLKYSLIDTIRFIRIYRCAATE
jgi:hypothetical protein